jgi:O-antigen/teichoic acid export membrane protein
MPKAWNTADGIPIPHTRPRGSSGARPSRRRSRPLWTIRSTSTDARHPFCAAYRYAVSVVDMPERRQIVQGTTLSLGFRLASDLMQFGSSMVLARLLMPEAFGLAAMVVTVTSFVALLVEAGVLTAIVQRPDLQDEHLQSAFVATVAAGVVAAGIVVAISPAVAMFYGQPLLVGLTRVSALGVFAGSFAIVPRAVMVRRMEIGALALIDFGAAVVSVTMMLGMAWAGAGVWALVLAVPATATFLSVAVLATARWRPRLRCSWPTLRPLLGVGLHLLAFSLVNYWARTADNILIGAWLGERELGLYARAYSLVMLPLGEVSTVLWFPMFPVLSRVQHDHAAARAAFLKALGLIALVGFPALLGLSVVAGPFISVLFGPSWLGAVPMLRLLAIVGALQVAVLPLGWLYTSQGRTDRLFRWGLMASSVTVAALAYGAWLGSGVQVAAAYLVANVLLLIPAFRYAGSLVGLRLADLRRPLFRASAAATAMALIVGLFDLSVSGRLPAGVQLASEVGLGIVSYLLLCRWLRVTALQDSADLLLEVHPRLERWLRPALALIAGSGRSAPPAR